MNQDQESTANSNSPAIGSDTRPDILTEQAARCRRLACATYNREVSNALASMADEYERAAADLCAANDR